MLHAVFLCWVYSKKVYRYLFNLFDLGRLPNSHSLLLYCPTSPFCKVTDTGRFIWETDFEMQNFMEEVYWGIFSRWIARNRIQQDWAEGEVEWRGNHSKGLSDSHGSSTAGMSLQISRVLKQRGPTNALVRRLRVQFSGFYNHQSRPGIRCQFWAWIISENIFANMFILMFLGPQAPPCYLISRMVELNHFEKHLLRSYEPDVWYKCHLDYSWKPCIIFFLLYWL